MTYPKIHLIPRDATGVKFWALCNTRIREGGRQAVATRKEFNQISKEERCLRCNAIINGRRVK